MYVCMYVYMYVKTTERIKVLFAVSGDSLNPRMDEMQYFKFLHPAVTISVTLVNRQTKTYSLNSL